jgi:alkylation response protein AidB-like acyl-CoA dehydrogenase
VFAQDFSHAFAWTEHVLGAPGYRLAGGTDEIQRNIIGERVLGLPREPRVDKPPRGGAG